MFFSPTFVTLLRIGTLLNLSGTEYKKVDILSRGSLKESTPNELFLDRKLCRVEPRRVLFRDVWTRKRCYPGQLTRAGPKPNHHLC